jgi:hypothetical protein
VAACRPGQRHRDLRPHRPAEELIGILLTQREMSSPEPPNVFRDFWTCAYQAIDD